MTTSDSAPQRYRRNSAISKNANHSTNLTSKSNEPHTGSTSNAQTNKPVTVVAGDSIIQNIRGWSLSKANKVVVKSFPGATTEDMEDFIKPILRKEPDNIIIHVGTNDVKAQEPRLKPGSHLCDKHKHKLAMFPHVKQAQENKAYASAVTLEEIWKYSRWRMNHISACA